MHPVLSVTLRSVNSGSGIPWQADPHNCLGGPSTVGTGQAPPRALLFFLFLSLLLLLRYLLFELLLVDLVHVSCVWCVCVFLAPPTGGVPSG